MILFAMAAILVGEVSQNLTCCHVQGRIVHRVLTPSDSSPHLTGRVRASDIMTQGEPPT